MFINNFHFFGSLAGLSLIETGAGEGDGSGGGWGGGWKEGIELESSCSSFDVFGFEKAR